jgi:hypothetical protein
MKSIHHTQSKVAYLATALLSIQALTTMAQPTASLVDFDAYETLVDEVKEHRKSHLLNTAEFVATGKEEKVIILDTRSDSMYAAAHVKGAVHLNFSDFTQDNLAKIIPSPDYKILIYCNNNFESKPMVSAININLERYFVTKVSRPDPVFINPGKIRQKSKAKSKAKSKSGPSGEDELVASDYRVVRKPITLALNIPTYINLYGYGYRNIYELSELVNTNSGQIEFEGTAIPIKDPTAD